MFDDEKNSNTTPNSSEAEDSSWHATEERPQSYGTTLLKNLRILRR